MKRTLLFVVAVAAGACSTATPERTTHAGRLNRAAETTTSTTMVPATTTTTVPPSRIGDELVNANNDAFEVHALVEFTPPVESSFLRPSPGFRYMAADVQGCAGPGGMMLNPAGFELEMADHTRAERHWGKEPALNMTDLLKGQCVRGWVTFEVPVGQRPIAVHFSYPGLGLGQWAV